ncbi:Lrp/AsnC family transcriptional regulator [Parvibium lacunae]|uniref:Lrp/AsnC family transcriptional regulator n=1 Tax=Parvibium lacunae TaxID=1888893 RepID=A0A368L3F2_9BURK|nr:Lrp/AsnC family transcriptional regulator [Parvibium lacunae]RCS58084.1 Lrp/AsnC family transcriptional regulator [Parvibium lacunae]
MKRDRTDWRILTLLQEQGRITNQQLAQAINLSPSACSERVRQLEQAGLIQGYQAQLDPAQLPAHVQMIAQITLRDQRAAATAAFLQHVLSCPQVVSCDLISGEFDFQLRVVCPDATCYRELTNAWLENLSLNIARIVSYQVLQTQRHFSRWPLKALNVP